MTYWRALGILVRNGMDPGTANLIIRTINTSNSNLEHRMLSHEMEGLIAYLARKVHNVSPTKAPV